MPNSGVGPKIDLWAFQFDRGQHNLDPNYFRKNYTNEEIQKKQKDVEAEYIQKNARSKFPEAPETTKYAFACKNTSPKGDL